TVKGTNTQGIAYLSKTDSQGNHSHSLSGTAVSAGAHAHTVGIGAHQHPVIIGAHAHSFSIGSHGHTITVDAAGVLIHEKYEKYREDIGLFGI
ncbi:hypothetical protein V4Y22_004231, partial [Escherichia coli]